MQGKKRIVVQYAEVVKQENMLFLQVRLHVTIALLESIQVLVEVLHVPFALRVFTRRMRPQLHAQHVQVVQLQQMMDLRNATTALPDLTQNHLHLVYFVVLEGTRVPRIKNSARRVQAVQ